MKTAQEYNELTGDKRKFCTIMYEREHPVTMGYIEDAINKAVSDGQYLVQVELSYKTDYDIYMIIRVLQYYGFGVDWSSKSNSIESCQAGILTIHWS